MATASLRNPKAPAHSPTNMSTTTCRCSQAGYLAGSNAAKLGKATSALTEKPPIQLQSWLTNSHRPTLVQTWFHCCRFACCLASADLRSKLCASRMHRTSVAPTAERMSRKLSETPGHIAGAGVHLFSGSIQAGAVQVEHGVAGGNEVQESCGCA